MENMKKFYLFFLQCAFKVAFELKKLDTISQLQLVSKC